MRSLVELHGGTVHATSLGQRQGASFCVKLPVLVVRSASAAEPRQHPSAAIELSPAFAPLDLSGLTVLVVDDDARELARRVAGFVAHLSKPVEPPELLATVASAAGRTG